MEILVEISEDEYATLLSRLTEESPAYSILKNALAFGHPTAAPRTVGRNRAGENASPSC